MVYMMLGTGFEEIEAIAPIDLLRRAGIEIITVGLTGKTIIGSHNIPVETDITIGEMDLTDLEMVIIPGGLGGVASIRKCPEALNALRFAYENDKYIGAICAGPTVLAGLGITDGRTTTCFPNQACNMGSAIVLNNAAAVTDGKLITGASAGCAIPFGLALIAALKGSEQADAIKNQIVIR